MYSVGKTSTRTYAQGLELLAGMIDWNKVHANAVLNIGGGIFCIRTTTYVFDGWSEDIKHYRIDISIRTFKIIDTNGSIADYSSQQMSGALFLYCNGRMQ